MSLLFPAYLAGLLCLALPWILHRFSDQKPPEQLFPSRRFLEATTPPVSRKRTVRYKALLALRILSLLLLCLLFAQPWMSRSSLPVTQQFHHLIVVDQSLSMRTSGRWESALDNARDLITRFGEGSAQLVGFDQRVSVVSSTSPEEGFSGREMEAALDNLQPGYAPNDYGLLMQRLNGLVVEQPLPVKVWLISDMQQSSLPAQLNALYAPNIAELELIQVDIENQLNVHLAAEANSTNGATANIRVSILASLSGANPAIEQIERTLLVESNGRPVERRSLLLTPGEISVTTFDNLTLAAQSAPDFTVSLVEPDALMDDNTQRLPIVERQPTSVVLLNTPGSDTRSASVFVTTALETDSLSSVERISGTVLQVPADASHLVIGKDLSDPLDLDLLQFVDTGSNALVFNQSEYADGAAFESEGTGIGVIDETHPMALGDIQWFGTRFYNLPDFEPLENDKVLIQSALGQSILIERPTNRGHLLILNDPLDGLASNLPLQPAFVDLLQSLIRYFDASTAVPSQVVIGERVALPANVQLIDPDGNAMLDIADRAISKTVELEQPGVYTIVSMRTEQKLRAVLDLNEANISTIGEEALSAWQARYSKESGNKDSISDQSVNAKTTKPSLMSSDSGSNRFDLWHWIFPFVAFVLFAEGWLANHRLHVRRDGS